ncbi:MAG: hypothetical protein INR71_13835, partial [Terriglobus roseus]|nr:hypothetical protein [Terriglobus roseus]
MSSAAIQSSSPALANSQYQQAAQLAREQYYQQQQSSSGTSPSTARRHRSAGGNGASPHTPQQPSPLSPANPSVSSVTPRAQQAVYPSAASSGPPISPPQRTSSHQMNMTASAGPTPEQHMAQLSIDPHGGQQSNSQQSRRRQQQQPSSRETARASSGKAKESPSHSRSQNNVGETPLGTQLPREESNIVNRIVASDPQEDVLREQERMREAQGLPVGLDTAPTGLALVGSEGVDDGGRGAGAAAQPRTKDGKSRKEMKFGEYVLGQTLGEGEFGKVKMGWKRDGGVQVAIKLIRKESLDKAPNRLP